MRRRVARDRSATESAPDRLYRRSRELLDRIGWELQRRKSAAGEYFIAYDRRRPTRGIATHEAADNLLRAVEFALLQSLPERANSTSPQFRRAAVLIKMLERAGQASHQ